MPRFRPATQVDIASAAALESGVFRLSIQAATAESMQQQFDEMQANFAALNEGGAAWLLTHLELGGGGDGHTFMFTATWADDSNGDVAVSAGGDPDLTADAHFRVYFYLASQADALQAARDQVDELVAARFDEGGVQDVVITQTLLAGSPQGTRFMGLVATDTTGQA